MHNADWYGLVMSIVGLGIFIGGLGICFCGYLIYKGLKK